MSGEMQPETDWSMSAISHTLWGPWIDSLWEGVWKGGRAAITDLFHHYSRGREIELEFELTWRMMVLKRGQKDQHTWESFHILDLNILFLFSFFFLFLFLFPFLFPSLPFPFNYSIT